MTPCTGFKGGAGSPFRTPTTVSKETALHSFPPAAKPNTALFLSPFPTKAQLLRGPLYGLVNAPKALKSKYFRQAHVLPKMIPFD